MLIAMTGDTSGWRPLIYAIPMTRLAGNVAMFPYQRERCGTVIEGCAAPTIGAMAGPAIRSKTAIVVIIRSVTSVTVFRRALVDPVGMAGSAGQVGMPARQREAGVVVVEGCAPPAIGRVTGTAVRAELAVVCIPVGMTGVTVFRRALVNPVGMTGGTGRIGVSPRQRESGVVMVEGSPAPAIGVVTGAAIPAKLAIVFVVLLMAGKAVRGRSFENSVGMAGSTGNVLVPTAQPESRLIMIERDVCQPLVLWQDPHSFPNWPLCTSFPA